MQSQQLVPPGSAGSRHDNESKFNALKQAFVEKGAHAADERRKKADEFIKSDPLGVYTNPDQARDATSAGSEKAVTIPMRTRVRKKKQQNDIFQDFGKEHDSRVMQEVEIGGIMIPRFNLSRFWQNESDLNRWQQSLHHNARYDKLLLDVRHRWHTDFKADVAELTQQHNAASRSRSEGDSEKNLAKRETITVAIKDMQRKLQPKEKKPKKKGMLGREFHMMGGSMGKPRSIGDETHAVSSKEDGFDPVDTGPACTEAEAAVYHFLEFLLWTTEYTSQDTLLDDAFTRLDTNKNGQISHTEFTQELKNLRFDGDMQFLWSRLEKNGDGLMSREEFRNLKPYMLQGMVRNKIRPRGVAAATQSSSSRQQASPASTPPQAASAEIGADFSHRELAPEGAHPGEGTLYEAHHGRVPPLAGGSVQNLSAVLRSDSGIESPLDSPGGSFSNTRRRSGGSGDGGEAASDAGDATRLKYAVEMPRTFSLLLFRNGDAHHTGEVVFIRRRPKDLKDLLYQCGVIIKPMIRPVDCLLTDELRPLRRLEDVESGSAYILKGQEALLPPKCFFDLRMPTEPSLRTLDAARHAVAADLEEKHRALASAGEVRQSPVRSFLPACPPRAGSPPWPSQSTPQLHGAGPGGKKADKFWPAPSKLHHVLGWSGLGQLPQHKNYSSWSPVLGAPFAALPSPPGMSSRSMASGGQFSKSCSNF